MLPSNKCHIRNAKNVINAMAFNQGNTVQCISGGRGVLWISSDGDD